MYNVIRVKFSWFCILFVGILFIMCINISKTFNMDTNPGTWAIYAIPHSLSKMVFKSDKKYTSIKSVRDTFTGSLNYEATKDDVNKAINATLLLEIKQIDKGLYLWENEDKGIIDFISISFYIFGMKVQSILYFYFFVVFASSCMFIVANFNSPSRLTFLLLFYVMLYLIIPIASLHPQLEALTAPRIFPILSIIASLHCVLFALNPQSDRLQLMLVVIQTMIVVFVIHIRVVAYWQLSAIIISALLGFFISNYRISLSRMNISPLYPAFFLVLWSLLLQGYKIIIFPQEYKDAYQPMTRVVWHNIFSGLAFDPSLAGRYKLKVDDISIIDALSNYLIENNRENEWINLGGLDGGGRESGYTNLKWISYELVVKEMFFARCKQFPMQCLRSSFYYKPLSTIKTLGWAYGLRKFPPDLDIFVSSYKGIGDSVKTQCIETTQKLDANKLRAYLWSPVALIVMSFSIIILLKYSYDFYSIIGMIILTTFSIIPSVVGHPGAHNVLDTAVMGGMLIYTCIGIILPKILRLAYNFFINLLRDISHA